MDDNTNAMPLLHANDDALVVTVASKIEWKKQQYTSQNASQFLWYQTVYESPEQSKKIKVKELKTQEEAPKRDNGYYIGKEWEDQQAR